MAPPSGLGNGQQGKGVRGLAKQNIDWANLGFSYLQTDCHVRHVWRDGKWDDGELVTEPFFNVHIAATALHYGQSIFEGLKAFRCKDGEVRLFRADANARRMANSARRMCMAEVPEELFLNAVKRVVAANIDYVPPYGTGGSLYVRPLLFGSGAQIGVNPADEYVFMVFVLPVGAYYKGGLKPVRAVVLDDYDRSAPLGVGHVKVAGNYAASLEPHRIAHDKGFAVELYLDAREHSYIEEFGTSNFIGISQDGGYVTAASSSILPSVTNASLQTIAADMGMDVAVRPIPFAEVPSFAEIGACGTAVVITPVNEIVRDGESIKIGPTDGCGPVLQKLYTRMTAIQYGEAPDPFGWTVPV
ncbi:MAG: branched-chain amino acid aminotransferase [Lentisphaerae bacterium]|jgi:branched-chain amino acid aminotransferase|nr:branched-chain amino acid aminotransferase [Lentisphaerota bacterium]MBT4814216.1 branched-chain amino acid aminotransferase [Lentisphaerota bacterium]MBT5607160.1 branched-chain amino acid aminotransferase [Lentisphaerota bacterium]MBT7059490.1 branched-chain amino acid aminotransferase [Lentisphaerota bacterium]MBT7840327.1 branched-chain amino acid aminotransferase [Lentisphaerota bacterium]